jgi:hypothetical protein
MAVADVTDWIAEFGKPGYVWYAKRLSGNDTLATHSHQAGPYIPKDFLFRMFPSVRKPEEENPDQRFELYIDSHSDHRTVRAVWYNNKMRGGTRNECRLTGFGGGQSALLDPESTGALAVFAFVLNDEGAATECHTWVCRDEVEEDVFEDRLGPVEPKEFRIWEPGSLPPGDLFDEATPATRASCWLQAKEIPPAWLIKFPKGEEVIRKAIELRPLKEISIDTRLMRRRDCEYEVFRSIEEAFFLPRIQQGFNAIEPFLGLAQSILQSRKSRSGNSLEFHVREIFLEEGLKAGEHFTHKPVIEVSKRPDFLFPSQATYEDKSFPDANLRMLAAKTTCKDRWRQIINEADRIRLKHLITLQEGVSEAQFREMQEAGVQLIVPKDVQDSYPKEVKPHLLTFESFLADLRLLNLQP